MKEPVRYEWALSIKLLAQGREFVIGPIVFFEIFSDITKDNNLFSKWI